MKQARIAARLTGLALLLLACIVPHFICKGLLGRSRWPRRFLGTAGWIVGARVRVEGTPVQPHTLLLANHLSWLDILVLAGATGSAFVAKAELGRGFVGWLADLNSTIYVSRSARNSARNQAQEIGRALEGDQPVTLFPEGTTGAGDRLLPFRSTLLEAAVGANREVTVRPAVIDYGKAAREIAWHEESGRDNILRLLGRRGTIPVRIRLCPPLPPCGDRKLLAQQAHAAIERALAASDSSASRL